MVEMPKPFLNALLSPKKRNIEKKNPAPHHKTKNDTKNAKTDSDICIAFIYLYDLAMRSHCSKVSKSKRKDSPTSW